MGVVDAGYGGLAFERVDANGRLAVAINAGTEATWLTAARSARAGGAAEVLFRAGRGAAADTPPAVVDGDGTLRIEIGPRSAVVVRVP